MDAEPSALGRTVFVTGTDTGVGKTHVACALIARAKDEGLRVCGFKPVASGCVRTPEGLRNEDALALQATAGTTLPYEDLNPCAYEPAIAPHLAAAQAHRPIRLPRLLEVHQRLAATHDLVVVEGAGGWQVPLDETWTLGAWVSEQEWPVLLVVGLRLGCLNHALLSADAIARRTALAGWVANTLPPAMPLAAENAAALRERLSAPCLGVIGERASVPEAAAALDWPALAQALGLPKREIALRR